MVLKHVDNDRPIPKCFRAVLFRMVPKPYEPDLYEYDCFRAVLFRMVPKPNHGRQNKLRCFRAVLFRMVPKHQLGLTVDSRMVLELCCFEWFQNCGY